MTPQEILNVIEAFFQAILRILEALGFIKTEENKTDSTETTEQA